MPTGPHSIAIIRHGEKANEVDPTQPPFGIDLTGARNVHSLTDVGWQRARALVTLFTASPIRTPFARPSALIAPLFAKKEDERRTYQTLLPLSQALVLPIQTPIAEDDEANLAQLLVQQSGADVLVCWEHHRIPAIAGPLAQLLGVGALPAQAQAWPDDDFSSALIFTSDATGSGFTLLPTNESVLPGDPIATA